MTSATLNNSGLNLRLVVEKAQAGVYQLVIKGAVKGGGALIQKTYEVNLVGGGPVGNFEFKFPDGIKSYKAGTRVLQPENGAVYECKPWPQSGYCVQWSPSASQFEPGTGRNWQDAWIAR
jgi:N-acetylglucosamine-binding protein A